MFAHTSINPAVTHARLGKQIIETNSNNPSLTVEFDEGFVDRSGNFVVLGSNHICLQDSPEVPAELNEDGTVKTAAIPARMDFSEAIMVAKSAIGPGYTEHIEMHLQTKIAELRQRG